MVMMLPASDEVDYDDNDLKMLRNEDVAGDD